MFKTVLYENYIVQKYGKKTHPNTGWPDKNEIVKRSTLRVGTGE